MLLEFYWDWIKTNFCWGRIALFSVGYKDKKNLLCIIYSDYFGSVKHPVGVLMGSIGLMGDDSVKEWNINRSLTGLSHPNMIL